MARKVRKPTVDFAVYLAVRLVVCFLQAIPPAVALAFADLLAWVAHRVDRRHRAVAAENLRFAFPELAADPHRIDQIVRATYRHFTRVAVEIVLLARKMHLTNWRKYVTIYPCARMLAPVVSDRPAFIVTGHFGNWEMAGYFGGAAGFRTHAIARVLDNAHLERFLKRLRQKTGQTIIAKKDDFDQLTGAMAAGGKVATLADQDAGPRGLFVNFFGRPASTHKAVALMAIEYDAPMAVIGVPRLSMDQLGERSALRAPMFYAMECEDVIDPRDYADHPNAVRAITERYTAALERLIRRHPEQYFWLHRRWKSQPAAKKAKKPAPEAQAA